MEFKFFDCKTIFFWRCQSINQRRLCKAGNRFLFNFVAKVNAKIVDLALCNWRSLREFEGILITLLRCQRVWHIHTSTCCTKRKINYHDQISLIIKNSSFTDTEIPSQLPISQSPSPPPPQQIAHQQAHRIVQELQQQQQQQPHGLQNGQQHQHRPLLHGLLSGTHISQPYHRGYSSSSTGM